jgi:hypothetical protein
MSLYNIMQGYNPMAWLVLKMLNLDRLDDIPRFRDAWISPQEELVIYTRSGGGNRNFYNQANYEMTFVPGYIRDEDDSFDTTYALFYYKPPVEYEELVKKIVECGGDKRETTKEVWERLLEEVKSGKMSPRVTEATAKIAEILKEALK